MSSQTGKFYKLGVWAGILGPVLFVTGFSIQGIFRTDYDPLGMHISALALGPYGWIQMVNFILLGVLMFFFSRVVAKEFSAGKASRAGLILLTTLAVLFILSGIFVMDPADTPLDRATIPGLIHGIAGGFVFLLMPVTIFVYLRRFRANNGWQAMKYWSTVLGVVEALGVILFTIASKIPDIRNFLLNWTGFLQRIALVPFMLWLFVFALCVPVNRKKQTGV